MHLRLFPKILILQRMELLHLVGSAAFAFLMTYKKGEENSASNFSLEN